MLFELMPGSVSHVGHEREAGFIDTKQGRAGGVILKITKRGLDARAESPNMIEPEACHDALKQSLGEEELLSCLM